jgi:hypothetical protein
VVADIRRRLVDAAPAGAHGASRVNAGERQAANA